MTSCWRWLFRMQRAIDLRTARPTEPVPVRSPDGTILGYSCGYDLRDARIMLLPGRFRRLHRLLTTPHRWWWQLPIGSRTLLLGVHQPVIHTAVVAVAWWRLYGAPRDPRLWAAFALHDIGYWGRRGLDDDDGELHPFRGARIMGALFGRPWYDFCLLHSRFLAKALKQPYSRLAVADKLAVTVYPPWLYLFLANVSGEIDDYMRTYTVRVLSEQDRIDRGQHTPSDQRDWLRKVSAYLEAWALEHKDLKQDTWTSRAAAPDPTMRGVRP